LHLSDEEAGQVPPGGVSDLRCGPVLADPLGGGVRVEADDRPDLGEREVQLTQGRYRPRAIELGHRVVAVPGILVDARRR
jgi:hypothetical protein